MTPEPSPPAPLRARITHLEVRGFRSLRNVALDLPNLCVMIGANGAGKSNLIRFFDLLGWMLKGRHLAEFVEKYGGGDDQLFRGARHTPRMDALLRVDSGQGFNDYRFGLAHSTARDRLVFVDEAMRFSRHDRGGEADWIALETSGTEASLPEVAGSEQTPQPRRRTARTLLHLLRQCASHQFHDTSDAAPIKLSWDVTDCRRLRGNGGNLAAVLLHLREAHNRRYRLIERHIARVLPGFAGFVLEPRYGKVLLQWQNRHADKVFGAHLTSDGSLRLFCLITLLNLPDELLPDVLLIDEPELGLHPAAVSLVAQMIAGVADSRQVILATQSPALVDGFALESVVIADLDDDGATRLRRLRAEDYRAWLDDDFSVSDLWLQNIIGGQP